MYGLALRFPLLQWLKYLESFTISSIFSNIYTHQVSFNPVFVKENIRAISNFIISRNLITKKIATSATSL